ncbi:MAG: hypothetical protein IT436_14095 [Phycisphaerales bacterium]|nr:hypothetical protein [Phycisphaerales bacterium]
MSDGILTDLDELVMEVRDRTSRVYLQEAVAAYRGKAFRAAVVATWLAVVFDIISKMRELANQGDAEAKTQIERIDHATANTDIGAMQKIESSLLELSKTTFEFLTEREAKDLERLRDDRNHSAHPAFVQPGAMFVPTPDLVRSHIVHAANHLLRHPAVQGKSALARIKSDLLQPSFPSDRERAIQYFVAKYLNHVRHNLIETLVTVFLKAIVARTDKDLVGKEQTIGHCLAAIARQHHVIYDQVLREQLKHLTDGVDDETLLRVFEILPTDPQCWTRLEEPVRLRMTEMIDKFGRADADPFGFGEATDASPLLHGFAVPELKEPVGRLFRRLAPGVQEEFIARNPRPELGDVAVRIFGDARSFRGAESLARTVLVPMGRTMDAEHVVAALKAAEENGQIWDAGGFPEILIQFFNDTTRHHRATAEAWRGFLKFVTEHDRGDSYESLRERMVAAGMIADAAESKKA